MHPGFNQLVQDNWDHKTTSTTQYKLKQKLTLLKRALRQLNHENYQYIQERVKRAQLQLEEIQQRSLAQGWVEEGYQEVKKIADLLTQAEYLFYQQRAKHAYFKEVDRNTPFFHSLVKRNNKRREIVTVENSNGETTTNPEEVAQEFL